MEAEAQGEFAHNLKNLCGFASSASLRVKTHITPLSSTARR